MVMDKTNSLEYQVKLCRDLLIKLTDYTIKKDSYDMDSFQKDSHIYELRNYLERLLYEIEN